METQTNEFDSSSFNAVFVSFAITSVLACILKIVSMCYKSKCKKFKCCGILIVRDIEAESSVDRTTVTAEGNGNV